MKTTNQNIHNDTIDTGDLLASLEIQKIGRRKLTDRVWVTGRIAGHHFQALVFPEHAEVPAYEMGDSRISKYWLRDSEGEVASFDRGWERKPSTPIAKAITDLLAAGLAERVFGN